MVMWLKQSTAATVKLGPFVDSSDGSTAETELTISQADVRLSKNGGNMAQKNESTACTHDELGYYDCPLDTTDTGTLGRLRVMVSESGALPVWQDYMVVPANVWDSMFGADKLQAHVVEFSSNVIDAAALAADAATEIATAVFGAVLKGDWSALSGESSYSVMNALRFLRNDWEVAGGVLTIYEEDGTTPAWTKAVATDEDAPPVTGVSTP